VTADDLRQELITMLVISTGTSRAFWDKLITQIVIDPPSLRKRPNWSVKTTCGHRMAPSIRQPMNAAIAKLRAEWPYIDPVETRAAYSCRLAAHRKQFSPK
jgi:hypothetical protein